MSLGPPPSRHVSLTHTGDMTFKFVSSLSPNLASIRELFPKLTSVPSPVKNARDFHQLFSPVSNMPHVFKRRQRFPGEKWLGRDHFGNCSLKICTKLFCFFLMRGIPLLPEWSLTLPSWGQCLTDVKEFHMKSPSKCWASRKTLSVEPRDCVVGTKVTVELYLCLWGEIKEVTSGPSNSVIILHTCSEKGQNTGCWSCIQSPHPVSPRNSFLSRVLQNQTHWVISLKAALTTC